MQKRKLVPLGRGIGVVFPVPNGHNVHAEQFRQISLKEMELKSASLQVVPDGSWVIWDSLCTLPTIGIRAN